MKITTPQVMGIVNATPDSFYAASRCTQAEAFVERVQELRQQGAARIDLGGCSTRPGATPVSEEEEWRRLAPLLHAIKTHFAQGLPLSIDTFRPGILQKAYDVVGPFWANDVSGGADPQWLPTVAALRLPWIAMHSAPYRGPESIREFFEQTLERAAKAGVKDVLLDPGFGFHKTVRQNFETIQALPTLVPKKANGQNEAPLLVGISRKRLTYEPIGITPEDALPATSALHLQLLLRGAQVLRVHDVAAAVQITQLYQKMCIFVNKQ